MKKFSKLIALVLVLSLVFAFTACGKGGSDDTIKLGILCSLTGNSQTNGGYAQQGAKMAVEEINAAGGINGKQIELVIEDDGGKADTAINAYNKLQSQKVVATSARCSAPSHWPWTRTSRPARSPSSSVQRAPL